MVQKSSNCDFISIDKPRLETEMNIMKRVYVGNSKIDLLSFERLFTS